MIEKIGHLRILFMTGMITDRIGLHYHYKLGRNNILECVSHVFLKLRVRAHARHNFWHHVYVKRHTSAFRFTFHVKWSEASDFSCVIRSNLELDSGIGLC